MLTAGQGWESPHADAFFKQQRKTADGPTEATQQGFYRMTITIGRDLHHRTKAFDVLQASRQPSALDMGMAPGGFSTTILNKFPNANVRAITLPDDQGGHRVHLRHKNLKVELLDINTLAGDLGLDSIPETHPGANTFVLPKLLCAETYDVAICGCQTTRIQQREHWRAGLEGRRLHLAQLVIAMDHLNDHGTLIVVSHRPEMLDTAEMLRVFCSFSDVVLFKPNKAHAKRSSFYMVAKDVRPRSQAAIEAVNGWREEWQMATLRTKDEYADLMRRSPEDTQTVFEQFGEELVALARPVWAMQAKALKRAPFISNLSKTGKSS